MRPTAKAAVHTVPHKAHQRIHQSTFAGTLRSRDCNGLIIDASCVDVSGGYELTHVCLIEVTITGDHLQYLLFSSHLVLLVTGSTNLSTGTQASGTARRVKNVNSASRLHFAQVKIDATLSGCASELHGALPRDSKQKANLDYPFTCRRLTADLTRCSCSD